MNATCLESLARRGARIARALAACALACAGLTHAQTPPGTLIPNSASATGTQGAMSFAPTSNTVVATVGGGGGPGIGFTLVTNQMRESQPGATVVFSHVLTNTGTIGDSYTLATSVAAASSFTPTGIGLFPDANGDGTPDSAVALAIPVALAPGQSLRFVLVATVPANAPISRSATIVLNATSAGGAPSQSNQDTIRLPDRTVPLDCAIVTKWITPERGASPSAPVTVSIVYNPCDKARAQLELIDRLPAGMRYVPGSGRWSGTGTAPLTDAVVGADRQGSGSQIAYNFGVSIPGAVTANVYNVAAEAIGQVSFQVEIEPGLAVGTLIPNYASFAYYDASGARGLTQSSNTVNFAVTGRVDLSLTGERLPSAIPGEAAVFNNLLTNLGDATDRFDITLAGSTFPAGTVFTLLQSDGLTPLADTDGNGTPDTGPVAPGASYRIVVRALIPGTTPPGSYKVVKTARSALSPTRSASAEDLVDTIATRCTLVLDPDNQALTGFGRRVTYTHFLTNRGNCDENVAAMVAFLGDSRPGWTSTAFVDNPAGGGASIVGAIDPTDTPIVQGWTAMVRPGDRLRVLVDVVAPTQEAMAAARSAKALVDTNVTTLTITGSTVGALTVRDTTTIDDAAGPTTPDNAIRNFVDGSYTVPTLTAILGRDAWIRADARACNAQPGVVETRTVVITGAGGEREEVTATETGADTGVFTIGALPVRLPPVVAGDRILQGRANDVLEFEILGCGRVISGVATIAAPVSVVFDSRSNQPVAGATVDVVRASGGTCGTSTELAVTVTDDTGRYSLASLSAGDYCVLVTPPNGYTAPSVVPWQNLPVGRNLNVSGSTSGGSYGQPFRISQGETPAVVDVPLDAGAQAGLFVQKAVSRSVAELGDMVDYVVRVRNSTGNQLDAASVHLFDDLPAGFAYLRGTARRNGLSIADPAGGGGPRLDFDVGTLARGQEALVTYRVRLGPGSLQGDGINRVQANYTANGASTSSNVATARVLVVGGVFSERAFILGKVYLDCNANGVQNKGEPGMPGVRLFLEDGTFVVSDGEGKYSFYGITNRTHVLKVDPTTLPPGARLAVTGTRNLGDPGSRIVDLKAAELHRGDFAISGCEPALVEEAKARAMAIAEGLDPLAGLAGTQLATEARPVIDVKALPAAGVISTTGQPGGVGAPALNAPAGSSQASPYANVLEAPVAVRPVQRLPSDVIAPAAGGPRAPELAPLETLVPAFDNTLAFVDIKDGDTLAHAQATIRVKGAFGASFKLTVNGQEVAERHVGKRSSLEDKQVQAWEYVGVELKAGTNEITLAQVDSFGNARGSVTIKVRAPGRLARLAIEVPGGGGVADGRSSARVVVKAFDANGLPVTARTPVSLVATRGNWQMPDPDPGEPGVQAFIEGGRAEFSLSAPLEPGASDIAVTSGALRAEARVDFLPELRNMIAAGVIEGVVNMRNISTKALVPTRAADGFEQELKHLSREWDNGKGQAGARASFFLKGKIKGDFLLTAAYDSDKDSRERLFRDIQPDEFYPVYGDSGVRGYDAQSTSKLYVRVDKGRSYLLWGDFTTQEFPELRKLSSYSRSLTGLKQHYENGIVSANVFASRDTMRQVIDELRANGTSGPYQLSTPTGGLINSEKVELITRDRNQPAIILATLPQSRFTDYEMEPLTGRILFRSPVASVDRDLNPVFIRVTYEVDQGGEEFWVGGVDAQVKLTDRIEVGGTYVKDKNPQQPFTLAGANIVVKLGDNTYVIAEAAQTERGTENVKGEAARLELKHESKDLKAQAFVARTDRAFDNPGAYLTNGRSESGGRVEYRLREGTILRAEALRTEDLASDSVRDGVLAAVSQQIGKGLLLEVGMRHAAEKGTLSPIPLVPGAPPPQPMPDEVTTARVRLTGVVPWVPAATIYGEAEVDVEDADRRILALGGEYQLPNRGRLYARHEFVSSITGPYGLNPTERQNTTAVGVDFDYMRDGRLFSEYRIRDALSGGDAEAAIGLKNLWTLAPGLRMGTAIERVHSLSGTGQNENTALAVGFEYTANPLWKGTTRLELRDATTSESLLHTIGVAAKLNEDWTVLGRNAYSLQRNKNDDGERVIERLQAGLAVRDSETNKWNALARVEHRLEEDQLEAGIQLKSTTEIVSVHGDWQPIRPFVVTGRYAAKWATERSNGLTSKYRAQVIGARATWEFAPRWDVAIVSSALFGDSDASRQYGVGLELGYLVATNLWVSAGYNFFGYRDADLSGADYTAKGPYVRLRYKFDEQILEAFGGEKK